VTTVEARADSHRGVVIVGAGFSVMWSFRRMLRRFDTENYRLETTGDAARNGTVRNLGGQRPITSQQPGTEPGS
jgi:hypothetical protein